MSRTKWKTAAAKRVREVAGIDDIDRAIRKIVEDTLAEEGGPPTNLETLAHQMGVADIRSDEMMLVPGELRKSRGKLVIFLLPNLTKTRRRFTLAHELGHVFFENAGRRPCPSPELERLCDKFAAEFLMPSEVFVSRAGQQPDLNKILDLCTIFETSLSATISRVSDIYGYRAVELDGDEVVWRRRMSLQISYLVRDTLQELSDEMREETIDLYENKRYTKWRFERMVLGGEDHKMILLRPV